MFSKYHRRCLPRRISKKKRSIKIKEESKKNEICEVKANLNPDLKKSMRNLLPEIRKIRYVYIPSGSKPCDYKSCFSKNKRTRRIMKGRKKFNRYTTHSNLGRKSKHRRERGKFISKIKSDSSDSLSDTESVTTDGEPIQLVKISKSGELELVPDAVAIISEIKAPVGVLIVIGPYRTGKSFLLNRILGRSNGFDVGPSSDPCTRGIWMWNKPLINTENGIERSIFLMDTEGLGSPDSEEEFDRKISILSYMISSVFIFNSGEKIDRESLKILSTITCFSNKITEIENETKPNFIWVLRNFFLRLEMKEDEYLEKNLKHKPISDLNDDKNNENTIYDYIKNGFLKVYLKTLPWPIKQNKNKNTSYEQNVQNLANLNSKQLNPVFRKSVRELRVLATDNLHPKKIKDVELNGLLFKEFLQNAIQLVNSNEMISITKTLTSTLELIANKALENSIQMYKNQFQDFINLNPYPLKWDTFFTAHKNIESEAIEMLQPEISFLPDDMKNAYIDKFKRNLYNIDFDNIKFKNLNAGLLFHYYTANINEIKRYNINKLNELWSTRIAWKVENNRFDNSNEFRTELNNLISTYRNSAFGNDNDIDDARKDFLVNKNTEQIVYKIDQMRQKRLELIEEQRKKREEAERNRLRQEELRRQQEIADKIRRQHAEDNARRQREQANLERQVSIIHSQRDSQYQNLLAIENQNEILYQQQMQNEAWYRYNLDEYNRRVEKQTAERNRRIQEFVDQQNYMRNQVYMQNQAYERELYRYNQSLQEYENLQNQSSNSSTCIIV